MIKAGDKVILDGVEYVIKEIKGNDVLLVKRDNALNIVFVNEKTLYVKLYQQQKQRADELERRWNELRDHVIARSDACKERRMIRERNSLIDVMAAMHDLEEDDNA